MENPKVSIVIPVYNMEKYLARCMDTVLNQSLRDMEIILVDDGSKDRSGHLCDEYRDRDGRVKVIHKLNAGLGYARNTGMEAATGKYVAFVDSDDYIDMKMYEAMYNLAEREGADTCICGHQIVRPDGKVQFNKGAFAGAYRGPDSVLQIYLNILGTEPSNPEDFTILWKSAWSSLYSLQRIRESAMSFPSEREFISEDIIFNMNYFRHAKCVAVTQECYYYYCANPGSLTKTLRPDRHAQNKKLYFEQLLMIRHENFYDEAKQRIQRSFLGTVRLSVGDIVKALPFGEAAAPIRDICEDPDVQAVLREYPWRQGPYRQKIFNFCLLHKLFWALYVLAKLKG